MLEKSGLNENLMYELPVNVGRARIEGQVESILSILRNCQYPRFGPLRGHSLHAFTEMYTAFVSLDFPVEMG